MKILLIALPCLLLTSCGSAPDPSYTEQTALAIMDASQDICFTLIVTAVFRMIFG
jgi:hypothetical protein